MDATIIIAIVPVVLLVAYIIWLVRAKITEGRDIDLREPITGVVICLVAVLIIGSMTASTVTYTYSEDTNTLYINQNLIDSNQPFDSYGDEIKSVVIGNNCRLIENGALDSLTNLEYAEIGKNVEVRNGAFSATFIDPFDNDVLPSELSGKSFAGTGDGDLYEIDDSLFKYYGTGVIDGLAADIEGVVNLVIPETHDGAPITRISSNSFNGNTTLVRVLHHPDSRLDSIGSSAFKSCSSLESVSLPDSATLLEFQCFYNDTALTSFDAAGIVTYGSSILQGCTSLNLTLSSRTETVGESAFNNCGGITEINFPSTVESLGTWAFNNCVGVTKVSFAAGFDPDTFNSQAFRSWTFYESDGTTTIDKTVASNLAGKTFMGTASALVEVADGQLSLTPQQLQQVQLHTQELQQQELDIQPLPFEPSLQTQEQEPVSA